MLFARAKDGKSGKEREKDAKPTRESKAEMTLEAFGIRFACLNWVSEKRLRGLVLGWL